MNPILGDYDPVLNRIAFDDMVPFECRWFLLSAITGIRDNLASNLITPLRFFSPVEHFPVNRIITGSSFPLWTNELAFQKLFSLAAFLKIISNLQSMMLRPAPRRFQIDQPNTL